MLKEGKCRPKMLSFKHNSSLTPEGYRYSRAPAGMYTLHAQSPKHVPQMLEPKALTWPCRGFRVWGLGFKEFWGLGFRVQGLGFRVLGLGFRVPGLGFRV